MIRREALLALGVALPLVACGAKVVAPATDDAAITARVKAALLNDPQVDGTKINVDTHAGVVTLTGSVKSKADEAHAVDVARRISGVRDVQDRLTTPRP